MSQYKRMISYVYQYIAGEKGQNIGFVRIEQRGGSLRIILQMRTIELSVMPEVWLFKQQSTGIEYIKAGKLSYIAAAVGLFAILYGLIPTITICGYNCSLQNARENYTEEMNTMDYGSYFGF